MSTIFRASQSPRYMLLDLIARHSGTKKASAVALSLPALSEAARFDRLSSAGAADRRWDIGGSWGAKRRGARPPRREKGPAGSAKRSRRQITPNIP